MLFRLCHDKIKTVACLGFCKKQGINDKKYTPKGNGRKKSVKNDLFNDRISRFSIRKLHVGVYSVLLGTLVMLGTTCRWCDKWRISWWCCANDEVSAAGSGCDWSNNKKLQQLKKWLASRNWLLLFPTEWNRLKTETLAVKSLCCWSWRNKRQMVNAVTVDECRSSRDGVLQTLKCSCSCYSKANFRRAL